MQTLDWRAVEQTLFDVWWDGLRKLLRANPKERFYVFALHCWAIDDDQCALPYLAANSEQRYAEAFPDGESAGELAGTACHPRWSPPEWSWYGCSDAESQARLDALTVTLHRHWLASSPEHEADFLNRFLNVLTRIAIQLRRTLQGKEWVGHLAPDLVVLVISQDGECSPNTLLRLLRRCAGAKAFARLFFRMEAERLEARRVRRLATTDQIRYHVACLRGVALPDLNLTAAQARGLREPAQNALRATQSPEAAHALLPLLDSKKAGVWQAAFMLAQICWTDSAVVAALRQAALRWGESSDGEWSVRALAVLGDAEWLLNQALATPPGLPDSLVATGLAQPYLDWHSEERPERPTLDYRPLELALSQLPHLRPLLEEELKPGTGCCAARPRDVEEGLRGLQSPLPLLRRHAAVLLGEARLGAAVGARVLPALAHALAHDDDAKTRFLVALSMAQWKLASAPWRATALGVSTQDPDESVRRVAGHLLARIDMLSAL